MDLESVTDELYELRPQDFTAARNERAAAARKAGDSDLARQIKDLRRPTLSAWAGNLLVRRRPHEAQSLISLGEGLRQAHRNLDGAQLRELGRRQHALVGALAREARQLAQAAGQPISDEAQYEVEATLHAVLADPQTAQEWATGHLARPLSAPIGFTEAVQTAVPQRKPPARPASGRKQEPHREQEQQEREQEQEQRSRLDQARKDARAAEDEAHTLEAEKTQTAAEKEQAEEALKEAEERASALARELKEAQQQRQAARNSAREARERAQAAERAAGAARRKAQRAAEAAERLAAESP